MWLTPSLRQRAGALSDAAQSFLEHWLAADAAHYRGGREGLVALCRELERFMHGPDIDEDTERRYVEGAGALLGVLLIDHIADARHVAQAGMHRVRLGAHGFFDPFTAIDRVLDAPDIRGELTRQVALAEAEASETGPLSRLVSALRDALQRERPDLRIEDQFDHQLQLRHVTLDEPLELDLRRAVESTRDQDVQAVDGVTRRLLSMLPGAPADKLELSELADRLYPRLARADAARDLSTNGRSVLLTIPLTDELVIALLAQYEGRARYVRQSEIDALRMTNDDALKCALNNLRAASQRFRITREQLDDGELLLARTGDGRDSARVLLPELYQQLSERLGPELCIAVPHRDTFMVCDARAARSCEQLAERAANDAARAPHALSARAHRLTPLGLR